MLNWCERWFPAIAAVVALFAALVSDARGWDAALAAQFHLSHVMSVTFNVLAFGAPLSVGLFAITLSPGGGFIQKLYGTKTYALFVDYTISALVLGVVALLATAPYLAVKAESEAALVLASLAPLWWAAAAAGLAATFRVVAIFLVWARSYSRPKRVTESHEVLGGDALRRH